MQILGIACAVVMVAVVLILFPNAYARLWNLGVYLIVLPFVLYDLCREICIDMFIRLIDMALWTLDCFDKLADWLTGQFA